MNIKNTIRWMLVILASGLVSCGMFKENFAPRNIAKEYASASSIFRPNHKIWIKDTTESILQTYLRPDEILFATGQDGNEYAEIRISILLYSNLQHTIQIDSVQKIVSLTRSEMKSRWIYFAIPFRTPSESVFYVKIVTQDVLRNAVHEFTEIVDNVPEIHKNTVLLTTGNPFLNAGGVVTSTDSVLLTFSDIIKANKRVKLAYFDDEIPLSPPPFNVYEPKDLVLVPKSVAQFSSDSLYSLLLRKKGMYQLLSDTAKVEGYCMFNFGDNYPEFKTPEELLEPLRYLISKNEYKQLKSSSNPKIGIDSLWLSFSNEPDKAREQIRVYYNRAKLANIYFSSITQGWRTDRGMIYIVFGAPTSVQVFEDKEVWAYGSRLTARNLEFEFYRIDNPFSNNHFILKRKLGYKTFYYKALESWRSGIVFQQAK